MSEPHKPLAQPLDVDELELRAHGGDVEAMDALALCLVDADPAAARMWFERAAAKGHADAMFHLGLLVDDDPELARQWYERAAQAGQLDAMNNLGVLLARNEPELARQWYERAAQFGQCDAMNNLGVLHEENEPDLARQWYERAAENGHEGAIVTLGEMLKDDDRPRAIQWLLPAAERGNVVAMDTLAYCLVDDDPAAARMWFERAAAKGHAGAMFHLGLLLGDDEPELARDWYERAAEAGQLDAMNNLGGLFSDTEPELARQWYDRAAQAGQLDAMNNLGYLLADSEPDLARQWYERAAENGSELAMVNLSELLETRDPAAALEWLEPWALGGTPAAMNSLALLLWRAELAANDWHFSAVGHLKPQGIAELFDPYEPDRARRWCERAVEAGDAAAVTNMGVMLRDSDPSAALVWFRRAAEGREPQAMINLGDFLEKDDPAEARHWYEMAAQAGHPAAADGLKKMIWRGRRRLVGSLLTMVLCAIASSVGFHFFAGTDYLAWYLANGTAIAALTGLVALTIDLDPIADLISPSPSKYLRACWMVVRLPAHAWAPALFPPDVRLSLPGDPGYRARPRGSFASLRSHITSSDGGKSVRSVRSVGGLYNIESDTANLPTFGLLSTFGTAPFTATIICLVMAAFLAWLIILAPLQYVTSAILGIPVRRTRERGITVLYTDTHQSIRMQRVIDPIPPKLSEVQILRRPVTTTMAISTLVLWLVSLPL